MKIGFKSDNKLDAEQRPAGGYVCGTGFTISWQDGPLGRVGSEERVEPNGAFVEDVIAAALQRIEHYQDGEFACDENKKAVMHLQYALDALDALDSAVMHLQYALDALGSRTKRRTDAGTEGTHEGK